jgi:predicted methyltransferase
MLITAGCAHHKPLHEEHGEHHHEGMPHRFEDAEAFFAKALEKLKPEGRVVIIDYTKEAAHGPPKEMRFTADEVTKELERAGLKLVRAPDILPEQYFLIFGRAR